MKVVVRGNVNAWQIFLDGLASEGGNILILFLLLFVTAIFVLLKFQGSTEQVYFVLGALIGVLKGRITHEKEPPPEKTEEKINLLEEK